MRTRLTLVGLLCLMPGLALAAPATTGAGEAVTLSLRSTAGTVLTYNYQGQFHGEFDLNIPDRPPIVIKPKFDMTAAVQQRTVSVGSDGLMEVAYQVKGFQFGAEVSNVHFGFAITPEESGLVKLPELPVHATINRQGKLTGLVGLDELLSALPLPPMVKGQLPSGEALQKMLDTFYQPMFPEKAIKVGDSWGWERTLSMADFMPKGEGGGMAPAMPPGMPDLKIPMKEKSTFTGWEQFNNVRCARVDSVTDWSWAMAMPAEQGGGLSMAQKGTVTVTRYLDTATGRLAGLKQEVHFTQDMTMQGKPMGKLDFTATSSSTLAGVSAGG